MRTFDPADVVARLPRNKFGNIVLGDLTCPHCGVKSRDRSGLAGSIRSEHMYHGVWLECTLDTGGCGEQVRLSITPDGIALLTPEQWQRQFGGAE